MAPPEISAAWRQAVHHLTRQELAAALPLLEAVLAAEPGHLDAREAMGNLCMAQGLFEAAERHFRHVADQAPERVMARLNLAEAVLRAGRLDAAEVLLTPLLAQYPQWPSVLFARGRLRWARGEAQSALADIDLAAMGEPKIEQALDSWVMSRLLAADWTGRDELTAYLEGRIAAGRNVCQPLTLMHLSDTPSALLQCARTETARHYPPRPAIARAQTRRPGPIRLAYLSSDFCDHPVGHQIVGVLERHDRGAFEVTAISFGPDSDAPIAGRLKRAVDNFMDINGMDDLAAARLMVEADIDIAVVLNGFTARTRPGIAAHRPAPVQVSAIGYPGSMGAPYIDYILADRGVISPGEERFYSERIAFLPNTYQSTDDRAQIGTAPSRADEGLPDDVTVFAALSKTSKITRRMFGAWMRILQKAPDSVLWLMDAGPEARGNMLAEAERFGIGAERLVFAKVADRNYHLARHALADLFLDTAPYGAHSTASDALWAGLPMITCRGQAFAARVCASVLAAAGLSELVTESITDYEALAVALARDAAKRVAIRRKVASQVRASALFDTAQFTRHLEAAYAIMHERRLAGLAPDTFAVEPSAI